MKEIILSFRLLYNCIFILSLLRLSYTVVVKPPSDFFSDIDGISIATGHNHKCALENKIGVDIGGKARCWGDDNRYGEIDAPDDIIFVQLVAGDKFTCGITIDQNVLCWGNIRDKEPSGFFSQITAASKYVCGVMTDGRISCWGTSPVVLHVPNNEKATNFVQVSCSTHHCCALDDNAFVECFGPYDSAHQQVPLKKIVDNQDENDIENEEDLEDFEKQINDEFIDAIERKIQFKQISVGKSFSCGIVLKSGDIHCWGDKTYHYKMPHVIEGPFRQVSVGNFGVCAIYGTPKLISMEIDDNGAVINQEITGKFEDSLTCWGVSKMFVDNRQTSWDQISIGETSGCGVTMESEIYCWGGGSDIKHTPDNLQIA